MLQPSARKSSDICSHRDFRYSGKYYKSSRFKKISFEEQGPEALLDIACFGRRGSLRHDARLGGVSIQVLSDAYFKLRRGLQGIASRFAKAVSRSFGA